MMLAAVHPIRWLGWTTWLAATFLWGAGCSLDGLLKSDEIPPNLQDPALTQTSEGALAAYYGALAQFLVAFGGRNGSLRVGGLLGDELRMGRDFGSSKSLPDGVDARILPDDYTVATYSELQKMRGQASQAIGLLVNYAAEQQELAAHLYALTGYAEIFLAELFCSGVPLSTLDFDGDYTLRPGSATDDIFMHAIQLFDTALVLAGDSTRFMHIASIGKARALLGMGDYAAAAAVVASVPGVYSYEVDYLSRAAGGNGATLNFASVGVDWEYSVADREGSNGFNYITSNDPRTTVILDGTNASGYPIYLPAKYAPDGGSPIALANGIEARLIEAEAALRLNDPAWLTMLNQLRTDGMFEVDTQVVSADTTIDNNVVPPDTAIDTTFAYDTLWHAGIGNTAGLAPLVDPGTPNGRVDLLFRERAFWLFLAGHRQGDMRRLIRQYGRFADEIYPVGFYPYVINYEYGEDVTIPVPLEERVSNPLFTSCISRAA